MYEEYGSDGEEPIIPILEDNLTQNDGFTLVLL
jgi:hypothetical protein